MEKSKEIIIEKQNGDEYTFRPNPREDDYYNHDANKTVPVHKATEEVKREATETRKKLTDGGLI
jgi:hypothetical protein